jgi:hypothetical protein
MSAFGADWSSMHQLRVDAKAAGESFSLSIPVEEDRYDVTLYNTRGPSYGDADVRCGGVTIAHLQGFEQTVQPGGAIALRNLAAKEGKITLEFLLKGKDPRSSGYTVGLDAFILKPRREYIPAWQLIGPFPNPRDQSLQRLGLDIVYDPEREIDLQKTYTGVNGQKVAWQEVKTPPLGRVDLYIFDPYEMVVVYALTYIRSAKDQTLPLLLGSDDGVKVFLNGKEIHRVLKIRVAEPDQDRVSLQLKKGWNTLLLKIENNFGGYNFFARVLDPEKSLQFQTRVQK